MPNEEFFAARLRESAGRAGVTLQGAPRLQLRSKGWVRDTESMGERETAYATLGSKAADWLAREGRGPYVEAVGRGLLPEKTPAIEGYEIAARSILATETGGDLYDFVPDSLGRIWIAAGDVSGHGYSCAIAQAMTKLGLASLVEADRTPAMVLARLDRVLRGIGSPRTFTTLALLRLDPKSGEVLMSNAGHPYPWIVSDGVARELDLPSLPLGQGPLREYADQTFTLTAGTTLVLSSDGLFEGTDVLGQAYGFDRIGSVLTNSYRRSAAAILDAILEDWRSLVGLASPADDTTIVVVKRNA